ncbi:MAG TPA: bacteriophage holin [Candidatus Paceibacterota bacterium]|jgi:hypothetical protein|nr:hypothetical protein [Parcubacteria group bacterium]MDP6119662.1 bacteriophage holin [Candidatus Paceibacterota bacterium]HJN62760.1 bacteriophage holin [Candidatus Paceibacterota bacterium]|tara:strand:- start:1233 stop:1481 length:249 start_codon:yes stop_codon:yes gene_type:complete
MYRKFHVNAFGLALGLLWAGGVFVLGLLVSFGHGEMFMELISSFYPGYEATLTGSVIGAVWAFVNAYIGGVIFAWLYNKLSQ